MTYIIANLVSFFQYIEQFLSMTGISPAFQDIGISTHALKVIDGADEAPPAIHPSMAERYRKEVGKLVVALNDKTHRAEAATLIRELVDRIVLTPNAERSALMIDLHGDLAGILNMANGGTLPMKRSNAKPADIMDPEVLDDVAHWVQGKMVAGAGFEPAAFRL